MKRRTCQHLIVMALGGCLLAGCGPTPDRSFLVSGAPAEQAPFRNKDANINDQLARNYCADGYQRLEQKAQPADSGTLDIWRVRCTSY